MAFSMSGPSRRVVRKIAIEGLLIVLRRAVSVRTTGLPTQSGSPIFRRLRTHPGRYRTSAGEYVVPERGDARLLARNRRSDWALFPSAIRCEDPRRRRAGRLGPGFPDHQSAKAHDAPQQWRSRSSRPARSGDAPSIEPSLSSEPCRGGRARARFSVRTARHQQPDVRGPVPGGSTPRRRSPSSSLDDLRGFPRHARRRETLRPARRAQPRNRGRRSPWFSRPVLEQPRRHPALRKPATETGLRRPWEEDDALALDGEIHGRARIEPDPLPKIFRDHDLALGSDTMNHTGQV